MDGAELPSDFGEVVEAVTTFADPLARRPATVVVARQSVGRLLPT